MSLPPDIERRFAALLGSTSHPQVVAIAGPNGAGKSTFYEAFIKQAGLAFVNADVLAKNIHHLDVYQAAEMAAVIRKSYLEEKGSFAFETVFSDPEGEKLQFLIEAMKAGYTVVMCFIGISGADRSEQRVGMRVLQGGHDVPSHKLVERFPRTMRNLVRAMSALPYLFIFDNDDLNDPFRLVEIYEGGSLTWRSPSRPAWLPSGPGEPTSTSITE